MAKPEWGVKRSCQSCGARFYDMLRTPVICPKCQSAVELEVPFKVRRAAAEPKAPKPALVVAPVVEADIDELEAVEGEEGELDEMDGGDSDESGLIEDASDLGEDDDDMAEVMEHMDENLEDEV